MQLCYKDLLHSHLLELHTRVLILKLLFMVLWYEHGVCDMKQSITTLKDLVHLLGTTLTCHIPCQCATNNGFVTSSNLAIMSHHLLKKA
jgi:hypothetical protein